MSSECKKSEKHSFCCKMASTTSSSAASNDHASASGGEIDMIRLNSALHELGLLSSVTESRKQYLQENASKHGGAVVSGGATSTVSPHHLRKGFCVLHMNANYVTDFSGTWKSNGASAAAAQHFATTRRSENTFGGGRHAKTRDLYGVVNQVPKKLNALAPRSVERLCSQAAAAGAGLKFQRSVSSSRKRFQKPYEIPWMHKLESRTSPWLPESDSSSKDSGLGNRSNPGSPEKVALESGNGCLVRSRSLDDIEAIHHAETVAVESDSMRRTELDTMSQCMEDLHVN